MGDVKRQALPEWTPREKKRPVSTFLMMAPSWLKAAPRNVKVGFYD